MKRTIAYTAVAVVTVTITVMMGLPVTATVIALTFIWITYAVHSGLVEVKV